MFSCSRFYKANAAAISITQNPAKVAELRSTTLPFSANLSLRTLTGRIYKKLQVPSRAQAAAKYHGEL